eukprot:4501759-Prymnesium_polylepis.1
MAYPAAQVDRRVRATEVRQVLSALGAALSAHVPRHRVVPRHGLPRQLRLGDIVTCSGTRRAEKAPSLDAGRALEPEDVRAREVLGAHEAHGAYKHKVCAPLVVAGEQERLEQTTPR